MSKLDSLVVDLAVNSAALKSGLEESKAHLRSFGASVEHISEQLRGLMELKGVEIGIEVIKGLGEFIQKGAEAAAAMGELAVAAGVPVESFSKLAFAASMSNVGAEGMAKAFKHLNSNLAEAGAGIEGPSELFKAFNINIRDATGSVKAGDVVFKELAEKFSQMSDGASKSTLAVHFMGKEGAAMLPVFEEGAAGLEKYGAALERLGGVTTGEAAASAKEFEIRLKEIRKAFEVIAQRVAAELTPALGRFADMLVQDKDGTSALTTIVEDLVVVLKALAGVAILVGGTVDVAARSMFRLAKAFVDVEIGDFSGALENLKGFVDAVDKGTDRMAAGWHALYDDNKKKIKEASELDKKSSDEMLARIEANKKAHAAAIEAVKKAAAKAAEDEKTGINHWLEAMKTLTDLKDKYDTESSSIGKGPIAQLEAALDHGELKKKLDLLEEKSGQMRDNILDAARAALEAKIEFNEAESKTAGARLGASTAATVEQRTKAFNNIGITANDQRAQDMSGFASFNAAMEEYARQTKQQQVELGRAASAKIAGDLVLEAQELQLADAAGRAAGKASLAADAFQASAQELRSSVEGLVGTLTSKMGAVGDVVQSAMAGFKSGGFIGAIVGAIGAIITKLQGFTDIVTSMNAFFGRWLAQVNGVFKPLFDGIIRFAESIGSAAEMLTELSGTTEILYAVFFALGKVLDVLTLGILYTAKFFADMVGGNKDINDRIKDTLYDLKKQYHQVDTPPPPLPTAQLDRLGDSATKLAEKFGELNVNMPSGYKLGAAIFGADNGTGGWSPSGSTAGFAQPMGSASSGGSSAAVDQGTTTYHPKTGVASNQGDANVTNESTRPPAVVGFMGLSKFTDLTGAEKSVWLQSWGTNVANGVDSQTAAGIADQAITALRSVTGSSSGAATAVSNTGGSGVTNIGGGNRGIQTVATAAPSEGGDTFITIEKVELANARSFDDLVRKITEVQLEQAGQRRRNPVRARNR